MKNEVTKLTLSNKELELVCNTDWIFTKHIITQKVYQVLGIACEEMQQQIAIHQHLFAPEVNLYTPKIAKGENYLGLPYLMLDYPRCFNQTDTIAIRTMFWWGNFFSMVLLLSGEHQKNAEKILINQFSFLQQHDYHICINDSPWEHHFNKDNFVYIKDISAKKFALLLQQKPFVKIAKKIPLQQWDKIPYFIKTTFNELIQLIVI